MRKAQWYLEESFMLQSMHMYLLLQLMSINKYYKHKQIFKSWFTHHPLMPHICVSELDSAPSHYLNQCWVIINRTFTINFSEILVKNQTFSFKKMHLKMSSTIWWPFRPGEDELHKMIISWRHQETMSTVHPKTTTIFCGQFLHDKWVMS